MHIEFGTGRSALADLSANGREQLRQLGMLLQTPTWSGQEIVIEGHTCTCGSSSGNSRLAQKRAETVAHYLVQQGFAVPGAVAVLAYGEDKTISGSPMEDLPVQACELDELHSMDRRVVIRPLRQGEAAIPPTALRTEIEAQVSFWYRPGSSAGAFIRLEDGQALKSGDEFRIFLMSEQPAYAYIFHHGSAGDWTCLFPNQQFSLA